MWDLTVDGLYERPYAWVLRSNGQWERIELPVLGRSPADPILGEQAFGRASALSYDGNTIGGMVGPIVYQWAYSRGVAARWDGVLGADPQVARLLPIENFQVRSYVSGINREGSRFLVTIDPLDDRRATLAFVGTDFLQVIDESPGPSDEPVPQHFGGGTSMDGAGTVAGYARMQYGVPFQWSSTLGVQQQPLPAWLPPDQRYGSAWAVSDDGRVVGGWFGRISHPHGMNESTSQDVLRYPSLWIDGVLQILPSRLFGTYPRSAFRNGRVTAISADGRVVAGVLNSAFPLQIFDAMSGLANKPALWIAHRLIVLDELLVAEGVDLQGVNPRWISGISHDGSTIAGWGTRVPPGSTVEHFVSFVATILPPGTCDDIDFNRDGNRFDPLDIEAFLSVFSEGPCVPATAACRDIDFNNDGSLFDPDDVDAFFRVFSEGPCEV